MHSNGGTVNREPRAAQEPTNKQRRVELLYRIGVAIKGLDGTIELLGGILLLLSPSLLGQVLAWLSHTDSDDTAIHLFVSHWAGHLAGNLSTGTSLFATLFLLSHGVVKIVLVYCLLKEYHWVYPYALTVLALFTVYQTVILIQDPTIALSFFLALDLLIIWVVWREWRVVKSRTLARPVPPDHDTPDIPSPRTSGKR